MEEFHLRDSQATLSSETWVLVQIPLIPRCVSLQSCSWGFTFSWAKAPGCSLLACCSVDPKGDAVLPSIPLAPALIIEDLERMAGMGEGMRPRQWGFHWKARKTPSNEALRKHVFFLFLLLLVGVHVWVQACVHFHVEVHACHGSSVREQLSWLGCLFQPWVSGPLPKIRTLQV